MPERVLQLISSQGCYGAERMLLNLAASLAAGGHWCGVAAFRNPEGPAPDILAEANRRGLPALEIPCRGRLDPAALSVLRNLAQRLQVGVLHCHGYKADCYARFCSAPLLVATCHNWPDRRIRMRTYAALDRLALRGFSGVAAVSPDVAACLRGAGLPDRRVRVIPNGIDLPPAGPAADLLDPAAGPLIGFAGRLAPEKGVSDLLHAARLVLELQPAARFALAGDGPLRPSAELLAARLGIASRVRFLGRRADMAACYAAFDLLVLPSHDEGLPLTLLEAMAAGLPVVATRVGFVPQAVTNGVTGLLVPPASPPALAGAILDLLGRPAWARQLGQAARSRAASHFSARSMASGYLDFYDDLRTLS